MSSETHDEVSIGKPAEWARFAKVYSAFVEEYPRVVDLANRVFDRRIPETNKEGFTIFGLGLMCLDDFEDIVTLVGNGRGFGAQKLLRGMYERIVTCAYLQANTTEVAAFVQFEKIRTFKLAQEIHQAKPDEASAATLAERTVARDEARPAFQRRCTCHSSCERVVDGFSWTPLSFPALAAKAGWDLGEDVLVSYSVPLSETHPTFLSLAARLSINEEGSSSFRDADTKSREVGRIVLAQAHKYAIRAIEIQVAHFPELKHLVDETRERVDAWNRIYEGRPEL